MTAPKGRPPKLARHVVRAIQARIGKETADELAECFEVHVSTIYKCTRGLDRARRRYAVRLTMSDADILKMAARLTQAQMARKLGVSRTSICLRLKKIRLKGMRAYDKHAYQERSGTWGGRANP
jgi:predicted transcriptional regulator